MDSFVLIIFGITGNLAQIKLIPALYDIAEKGLLPESSTIVGIARAPKTDQEFRDYFHQVLHLENRHHKHEIKDDVFERLCRNLHYLDGNLDDPALYKRLKDKLIELEGKGQNCHNRIFYLATYPDLYEDIFKNLKKSGLNTQTNGWVRLMIEKPIGQNLKSAKKLNKMLLNYFTEDQIYRLDHYLGKETLHHLLDFRFRKSIFEKKINNKYIDNIQIIAAEDFGIGKRGRFYDLVGALKDVGQNHLLQMLAVAIMDNPGKFTNEAVTAQRLNILKNLKAFPGKLVLGKYKGYTKEENVDPKSRTDTFFAFKLEIESDRYKGIPIYIRGGKMLKKWLTEISVIFKNGDILTYKLQPKEAIIFKSVKGSFVKDYHPVDPEHVLVDPYERLIFDATKGDQTNFNDAKEIEAEWKFIDQLRKNLPKSVPYQPGSWGPKEANQLLKKDGREWINS